MIFQYTASIKIDLQFVPSEEQLEEFKANPDAVLTQGQMELDMAITQLLDVDAGDDGEFTYEIDSKLEFIED